MRVVASSSIASAWSSPAVVATSVATMAVIASAALLPCLELKSTYWAGVPLWHAQEELFRFDVSSSIDRRSTTYPAKPLLYTSWVKSMFAVKFVHLFVKREFVFTYGTGLVHIYSFLCYPNYRKGRDDVG